MEIKALFQQYLNDNLTEEEFTRFYEGITSYSYDPGELASVLEELLERSAFETKAGDKDRKEVLASILAEIDSRNTGSARNPASSVIRLTLRRWIAIAAALILVLFAGYLILHKSKTGQDLAQQPGRKFDAAPGRNGAILTLADGKRMELDSVANGTLEKQGNAKVLIKDGQLTYTPGKGEVANPVFNTLSTPRGRQFQIELPDGTKAWLNAASSIRYPTAFSDKERKVEITGEVYFEVAQNAHSPFFVTTAQREIRVLGTHFNVNAYADEPALSVTLLEGSVKVTSGNNSTLIRPGQQLVSNAVDAVPVLKDVDTEDVVAWINGRFKFENSDIRTVMRQIARWYNVEVEYQGTPPNFQFAGGTYRNINLSEVLKVLELSGVHFKLEENKIIVMP